MNGGAGGGAGIGEKTLSRCLNSSGAGKGGNRRRDSGVLALLARRRRRRGVGAGSKRKNNMLNRELDMARGENSSKRTGDLDDGGDIGFGRTTSPARIGPFKAATTDGRSEGKQIAKKKRLPNGRARHGIADVVGNRKIKPMALIIRKRQGLRHNRTDNPAPWNDIIRSNIIIVRIGRISGVRGDMHRLEEKLRVALDRHGGRNSSDLGDHVDHGPIGKNGISCICEDSDLNGDRGLVGKMHVGEVMDMSGLAAGGRIGREDLTGGVKAEVAGDNEG